MTNLFRPNYVAPPQVTAAPTPPPLPTPAAEEAPRYKRMPTMSDPDVLIAAQRTRAAALKRRGRLSTILTDQTQAISGSLIGSSGTKLGA